MSRRATMTVKKSRHTRWDGRGLRALDLRDSEPTPSRPRRSDGAFVVRGAPRLRLENRKKRPCHPSSSPRTKPAPPDWRSASSAPTGMVGEIMRSILAEREFPRGLACVLFASARSAGRRPGRGRRQEVVVEGLRQRRIIPASIVVFFSAGGCNITQAGRRVVAAAGAIVIDNSSAWRGPSQGSVGRGRGQSPCAARHPQGHRRQSQLHDDGCHAGAEAAARGGRAAAPGGQHLPGCLGLPAGLAIDELENQMRSAGVGATAPDARRRRHSPFRRLTSGRFPIAYNVVPLNYRIVEDGLFRGKRSSCATRAAKDPRDSRPARLRDMRGGCPSIQGHSLSINARNSIAIFRCLWRSSCCARRRASCSLRTCPIRWKATGPRRGSSSARVRARPDGSSTGWPLFRFCGDNLRKGGGAERGADRRVAAGARARGPAGRA